jgi:hypothetical protein
VESTTQSTGRRSEHSRREIKGSSSSSRQGRIAGRCKQDAPPLSLLLLLFAHQPGSGAARPNCPDGRKLLASHPCVCLTLALCNSACC